LVVGAGIGSVDVSFVGSIAGDEAS